MKESMNSEVLKSEFTPCARHAARWQDNQYRRLALTLVTMLDLPIDWPPAMSLLLHLSDLHLSTIGRWPRLLD